MLYFEQNIFILGRKLIDKAEFLEIIKLSYNTITFCKIELIAKTLTFCKINILKKDLEMAKKINKCNYDDTTKWSNKRLT